VRITRLWALLLAGTLIAPFAARASDGPGIHWEPDFSTALKTATREHKDVLVDFWTDWCEWCKVQDESTLAVPSFVEYAKQYVWVKVDAEHGADTVVARRYNVHGYPTVVVIKADGTEYDRIVGYHRPEEFRQEVDDYRAGRNTLLALLADAPKHERDWDFQMKLATKLYGYDRTDEAMDHYRAVFAGDTGNAARAEEAGYMVARTTRRANRFAEALGYYQALLARFPKGELRPGTIYGLGLTYKGLHNKEAAIEAFNQYLQQNPQGSNADDARKEIEALRNPPKSP
jgi:tetratricopeptide (TPR) repeat protein